MPANAQGTTPPRRTIIKATLAILVACWLFNGLAPNWTAAGKGEQKIRFTYWGGFSDDRMWHEIIDEFQTANPKTRIIAEWLPLSGYTSKIDQQFVAGNAPDVILFQDEPLPRYASEQFADLAPFIQSDSEANGRLEDCWPSAIQCLTCDGRLKALPISGGTVQVYCNLDAFARAALFHKREIPLPANDWTLDQFADLCKLLTIDEDGDGRPEQFGIFQPGWLYFLPFIWSHGAALTDDAGSQWLLRDAKALDAFTLYANLRQAWNVTPAPIDYAGQNSDTTFLSGRVAMCVNGPWFESFLDETALRDRHHVVPIPLGPGGNASRATWDGLCIYAKSSAPRQKAAWQFAHFVLGDRAQRRFAMYRRGVPARKAVADFYIAAGGGADSPEATFVRAMQSARVQQVNADWSTLSRTIGTQMTSMLLDGASRKTPDQALRNLNADPVIVRRFQSAPRQ